MGAFTTTYERIIRQPALTMPGNFTGSEAACTAGNASSIRTLLSLGTADSPSFSGLTLTGHLLFNATNTYDVGNGTYDPRTVRAGTSFIGPANAASPWIQATGQSTSGIAIGGNETNIYRSGVKVVAVSSAGFGSLNGYGVFLGSGSTADVYMYPVSSNVMKVSDAAGTTLGTINAAAFINTGAATTLGNSTYGVTVPGAMGVGGVTATAGKLHVKQTAGTYKSGIAVAATTNDSFLSMRWDAGDVFVIEPTWESTGAWKPLAIRTNGANRILFGTDGNIGIGTTGTAPLHVYRAGAATSLIESGVSFAELSLSSASGNSSFITSNRNLEFFVGGATRQTINSSTGATTFTGDIIMSKTSAQGYIRAYYTDGVQNAAIYHNGQGRISTSSGGVYLTPADGMSGCYTPLVHSTFLVYSSDATHSISLASNGTNGILSTSYGALQFKPYSGETTLYDSTGAHTLSITPTTTEKWVDSSSGAIAIRPFTGNTLFYKLGTNATIRVYDSTASLYSQITHDGTNGIVSTSSGNLNLVPTGGTVAVTGAVTTTTFIDATSIRCNGSQVIYTSGLSLDIGGAGGFNSVQLGNNSGASGLKVLLGYVAGSTQAPMLKIAQTATTVQFRRADDTVDAAISCAGITASGRINAALAGSDTQITCSSSAGYNAGIVLNTANASGSGSACGIYTQNAGTLKWGMLYNLSPGDIDFYDYTNSRSALHISVDGRVGVMNTAPATALDVTGGITASGAISHTGQQTGYVAKTANYTTTADDHLVNVTANSIDITLETAVGCAGRIHEIINTGSGTVTMKTTSAQTISGSASGALTLAQWKSMTVKSDGANWLIIAQIT